MTYQIDKYQNNAIDMTIFKSIGLYQLLCPTKNCDSCHWYRMAFQSIIWMAICLQIIQTVRLFNALDDLQLFLTIAMMLINGIICLLKGYIMVINADRLWSVLDVALVEFTSCGRQEPSQLYRCQQIVSTWLNTFIGLSFGTLLFWMAAPWFMTFNLDNSLITWTLIYLNETIIICMNVICWLLFDCYFVAMCFVLCAQFQTMFACYGTLGYSFQSTSSPIHTKGIPIKIDETYILNNYDELIRYMNDNQKIIKKYDEFFSIFRPMVLVQIANGAYVGIALLFLTSRAYLMGWPILSATVLKFFSGYLSLAFELYIFCYALNRLESTKSTLNFGLYSCNWTAMDLKFKQTVLLAMNMNSTHKRMMKVTPKSIINLEMFSRIMKMSYTVVSVILKLNLKS